MKVTRLAQEFDLLKSDLVRSPGLHMSDIYGALYKELDPKRYTNDPWNEMALAMGTAWEKHLEWLLVSQGYPCVRPDAFLTTEGIGFSPDLLITNGVLRLGEIKLTWMSSEADLTDPRFDKYLTQMKAYCHHLETPSARLFAGHVNGGGGYGKPDPRLAIYDLEFTARELRENWDMLLRFARQRKML